MVILILILGTILVGLHTFLLYLKVKFHFFENPSFFKLSIIYNKLPFFVHIDYFEKKRTVFIYNLFVLIFYLLIILIARLLYY